MYIFTHTHTHTYFIQLIFVPWYSGHKLMFYNMHFKDFIYLFLERGKGREKEKHQCVVASHTPPSGDLACNPGMCPDWESNLLPFASQYGAQSTNHTSQIQYFLKISNNSYMFSFREKYLLIWYIIKSKHIPVHI